LKRDLQNIDVNLRKLELDRDVQRGNQESLNAKVQEVASRYLRENVKWIGQSLTADNFVSLKQRLQVVIDRCRSIGFEVSAEYEASLFEDLGDQYRMEVRRELEREEQARIRAQIREEQFREKEIERELKQIEREKAAIQIALDAAIAATKDAHSAEVESLKTRLVEAEEKAWRTISRAQMTKSGHVYVISNIGSFGDGVFKVGMTRRLEPADRVRELGDASVPFPFDVHMMISADDAPALETALHRALHKTRLNKLNPRKEFFRTDLETIVGIVKEHRGEIDYVVDAEALQYRQSIATSAEDAEFIETTYVDLGAEEEPEAA